MKFHVIDKRTGKEPIFDHNHIFKEKWFKESKLIYCDIDGWYISEDGLLALIDDCGNCAWVDPDRFQVVFDNISQMISALKDEYEDNKTCGEDDVAYGVKLAMQIVKEHIKVEDRTKIVEECAWFGTKSQFDADVKVLEQIRAEIEELDTYYDNDYFSGNRDPMYKCNEVLQIIDKYKTDRGRKNDKRP